MVPKFHFAHVYFAPSNKSSFCCLCVTIYTNFCNSNAYMKLLFKHDAVPAPRMDYTLPPYEMHGGGADLRYGIADCTGACTSM